MGKVFPINGSAKALQPSLATDGRSAPTLGPTLKTLLIQVDASYGQVLEVLFGTETVMKNQNIRPRSHSFVKSEVTIF